MRVFLLLWLLLLPLSVSAQTDDSDRGFIQGLLEDALSAPGRSVRLTGFAGALSSRATIDEITVTDPDGVWFTATDVALTWNRSALLAGRIEIDEISAKHIALPRLPLPAEGETPQPEAGGAFALPDLPVSVNIAELRIDKAVLGEAVIGEAAELSLDGSAQLSGGAGEAKLAIERLDQAGTFTVEGAFDNATRVLALTLDLTEPENGIAANLLGLPGLPSVKLQVTGEDPLSDFEAAITLATDGEERLGGTVTLLSDETGAASFALDLGGDIAPVFIPEFSDFLGREVALKARGARDAAGALSLEQLRLEAAALLVTGSARIGADGWPQVLALDAAITPPQDESVVLPLPGGETRVQNITLKADFDAEAGDAWTVTGRANGFTQPGFAIATLGFSGSGEIARSAGSVSGTLKLDAGGIAPEDAALAQALGQSLSGGLDFGWTSGAPIRLREIDLAGADYGFDGTLTISGLEDATEALTLVPDLHLAAQDLGRFADLAGLGLAGAADLAISGRVEPLTGKLALTLNGTTRDLATGILPADRLLDGEGQLRLGLTRDETGLTAAPLRIETAHARIFGTAALRTGASEAEITARVEEVSRALPGIFGPAEVTARLNQTGESWKVDARASLPGDARASYLGTVTGDGSESLRIAGELSAAVGRLETYATLAGRNLAGAVEITATGSGDVLARTFDLSARGSLRDPRFGVPQAEALLPGTTTFDVSARRDAQGNVSIQRAVIDGAQVDADVSGAFGPETGSLSYQVSVADLGLVLPELPGAAQLAGTASRDGAVWTVDTRADLPGGTGASYRGTITGDGQQSLTAEGRVQATIARLAAFSPLAGRDLSGALDLVAEGRADLLNAVFDMTASGSVTDPRFGVPQAEALLRGTTRFDLSGARDDSGNVTIRRAVVEGQQIDAEVSGAFGPETGALDYLVTVDDLGLALPELPGAARLSGTANRDGAVWTVDTRADLPGDTGASYRGTVTLDGAESLLADGRLEADIARLSAFAPLAGRPLSGALSLVAEGRVDVLQASFDLTANGSVTDPRFGVPTVEPFLRGTTRFDIDAARDAAGRVDLRRVVIDGPALSANLSGGFGQDTGTLSYRLTVANIALLVPELPGSGSVTGTAERLGNEFRIDATGQGPGGIEIAARGRVASDGSRLDLTTSGLVPLALANRFLREQALAGLVRFDLAVNGPPALSSVSGRLSVTDAQLAAPAQGVDLTGITGGAELSGARAQLGLSANISTGGQIRISGPVSLEPPYTADLVADLVDVVLRDATLYEARFGGRLTATGPLTGGARIGGAIDIDEAELRIPDFGPSYSALDGLRHIAPPPDVQRTLRFAELDQVEESGRAVPEYPLDITLRAPNEVFVRGRGLDAELGGSLRLTGTTTNIVPVGSFSLIRGRLDLLGRRLTLTRGDVQLRGSFNPVINFEATTEVEGTSISLQLEGEASAPELTVSSVPDMPQDEALSFFLFGRDVTSISPLQAVRLAAAVRTLSGQGGLGLEGQLRRGLGAADLDIATDAEGNTEASVGTYISENIYTDVTVNSSGSSQINLNLDLTSDITVRGRVGSDGDTGIGIFFERDY
ncbi:MAG: hypothetical protein EP318_21255 [Rhodobacteraceae bacterium]|nr:MAG: hypothetical protein EP318_21255 [Paracoccaceae bacterium]